MTEPEPKPPSWSISAFGTDEGVIKVTLDADLVDPSTNPLETLKSWGFPPLIGDPEIKQALAAIHTKLEEVMGALEDTLTAVSTQLGKAKDEIVALITDLEGQIAANAVDPATVDALKAAAQSLDDVVPDVPPVEPPA